MRILILQTHYLVMPSWMLKNAECWILISLFFHSALPHCSDSELLWLFSEKEHSLHNPFVRHLEWIMKRLGLWLALLEGLSVWEGPQGREESKFIVLPSPDYLGTNVCCVSHICICSDCVTPKTGQTQIRNVIRFFPTQYSHISCPSGQLDLVVCKISWWIGQLESMFTHGVILRSGHKVNPQNMGLF